MAWQAVRKLFGVSDSTAVEDRDGERGCEPEGGEFGSPRVLVSAPDDPRFHHLAWPKIATAPDGTVVLAYVSGRRHVDGEGCPVVALSTNGGRSFSGPLILKEFDRRRPFHHAANLALGVAEDGAVVLLCMAFTGNRRNSVFGWRSTDGGRTWEA
jgi:hypothetical protein